MLPILIVIFLYLPEIESPNMKIWQSTVFKSQCLSLKTMYQRSFNLNDCGFFLEHRLALADSFFKACARQFDPHKNS